MNTTIGYALVILAAVAAVCAVGCASATSSPFWEMPAAGHPPTTGVKLELFPKHPRLVFRPGGERGPGRTFSDVRRLNREDPVFREIFSKAMKIEDKRRDPAVLAALWTVTGDDELARAAVARMLTGKLGRSGEPYYSNVWRFALAYDWLYNHPALTPEARKAIESKMAERLGTELDDLDDEGMALWHGRNQAANGCMIAALAIADLPGQDAQLRRAAAHYIESLRALEYTEGWPEGASYWIYNRAGPYALAADCVMSALGVEELGGVRIREVMRKIGTWQLYQYGPNRIFEPYGDSSGSLKLGETGWWELTTDHYARLSRDPALMAGADYLRNRSPDAYGKRPYYWKVVYTYDPTVRPKKNYDRKAPEKWMRANLPQSMLFGRDSMGVAFLRGKWGDRGEVYASFKAGDLLAHHDHYDTGHFSIQAHGGLLAPQTGLYGNRAGGYFGRHRLGYALQTVSANSLLVLAPGETSAYLADKRKNGKCDWDSLSGGQRVMRPTGFHCVGIEHYRRQMNGGPHLERATITQFESAPGDFDYVAADITAAYNSTRWSEPGRKAKVALVTRQFLYLREPCAFVVYDRVEKTRADYRARFLLHHLARPRGGDETVLAGKADDGILTTKSRVVTSEHGGGRLVHAAVLPAGGTKLLIGGPTYRCYVEGDGDGDFSKGFNGEKLDPGPGAAKYRHTHAGLWRTEIGDGGKSKSTRFLNLLFPRKAGEELPRGLYSELRTGPELVAVRVAETVCVFARAARPLESFELSLPEAGLRLLLLDAVPKRTYSVGGKKAAAGAEGVLVLEKLPAGRVEVR